MCFGQGLFTIGAYNNDTIVPLLVIGESIKGFAVMPLFFTQIAFVTNWFISKNLNFAMGIMISISSTAVII